MLPDHVSSSNQRPPIKFQHKSRRHPEKPPPLTDLQNLTVVPGGPSFGDCLHWMDNVKPHVLTIADDLTFTYTSTKTERETLHVILGIVLLPVTLFEAMVVRPCAWIYEKAGSFFRGFWTPASLTPGRPLTPGPPPQPPAATTTPPSALLATSSVPPNPDAQDIPLGPTQAFNLFVLLQQRGSPIPDNTSNPVHENLCRGIWRKTWRRHRKYLFADPFLWLPRCMRMGNPRH